MTISTLVLLGGTGDLAGRLLLPGVARLVEGGLLPDDFAIVAVSQEGWDDDRFRAHASERLATFAADVAPEARERVVTGSRYVQADVTHPDDLRRALPPGVPAVIYLALPNVIFSRTLTALAGAGVTRGSMLVIEKPFGVDQADAHQLNEIVSDVVPETSVFRVDHFLAKQTVVNILGLRFANRILEPVWNAGHVERVDIVFDESLGLEDRAGYYDHSGALRDMLQNHLMQLLCLIAMEPPTSVDERDLRDRKVEVLRAVQPPRPEEMATQTVRARYTAGRAGGRDLPSYVDEPGVDPARATETYAEITLYVDNWRWSGVPFRLRSGKGLAGKRQEIVVQFKPVPHLTFGPDQPGRPNRLRMTLGPDRLELDLSINGPGNPFDLEDATLDLTMPRQELPPYSMLLLEILEGDPTLSTRGDEAEESWRIVEPILAAWSAGTVPMEEYVAGSHGPRPHLPGE